MVTRADVIGWWEDVVAGRRTRQETSTWAEDRIEQGEWDEELVLQALLYLQSLTLVPGWRRLRRRPVHSTKSRAPFVVPFSDIPRDLERWTAELAVFDADPDAWMRRYLQRMLREHAVSVGLVEARAFGAKLVADGQLADEDVASSFADLQ